MARVEIPLVVFKADGTPAAAQAAQVNVRGGAPAVVYAAETGATTSPNPLTTDASGRIEGWVDEGSYDITVSGGAVTTYTFRFEAVRGDGVSRHAANSIANAALQDGSVSFAKLATDVVQTILPAGYIGMTGAAAAPAGWVLCNGGTYDGTQPTYSRLYSAIGTTWGGTGASSFKVPDLRGRSPIGAGTGSALSNRVLASQLGEENHILTIAELASHAHAVSDPGHSHAIADPGHVHGSSEGYFIQYRGDNVNPALGLASAFQNYFITRPITAASFTGITINYAGVNLTVQSNGSSVGHNNMQPSAVVNFIIKL
jgi:microcystin-dependent protein